MPAKKDQHKAAGAVLSAKRGYTPKRRSQGAPGSMVSMSEGEPGTMAPARHGHKPDHMG